MRRALSLIGIVVAAAVLAAPAAAAIFIRIATGIDAGSILTP
jgi:hypothetical protein